MTTQGLVAHNRGDKLPEHKRYLARSEPDAPKLKTLQEVLEHVQPTALMGLSTLGGAFTKESEPPVSLVSSSHSFLRSEAPALNATDADAFACCLLSRRTSYPAFKSST